MSDVTGKLVDIHVTEAGEAPEVRDPSLYEIAAIVPTEAGATREILAIGATDGSFRIPDVPEVPYDLRFTEVYGTGTLPPRFFVNAPREVDFSRAFVGRPNVADIIKSNTDLAITATGLSAWQDGDDLQIFSLGAGALGSLAPKNAFPAVGATELVDYLVDAAELPVARLIDGSLGDRAFLLQLAVTGALGAAPYRSVRKAFEPAPFSLVDGGLATIDGAFVDVPQKQISITVDEDAFKALAPSVNPASAVGGRDITIFAEPGGDRPIASPTPTLLDLASGSTLPLPSSFSYGNPFPTAGWSEVVAVEYSYIVTHTPTATGISRPTSASVSQSGPASAFSGLVKPVLGPPENVTVNDQPAGGELLGIGFSPTVRWSPPSVGTAALYVVTIRELDLGGSTTRTVALFFTRDTSLRIPPDFLDFGYYYYLRITAVSDWDPAVPFATPKTSADAAALTGVLSP